MRCAQRLRPSAERGHRTRRSPQQCDLWGRAPKVLLPPTDHCHGERSSLNGFSPWSQAPRTSNPCTSSCPRRMMHRGCRGSPSRRQGPTEATAPDSESGWPQTSSIRRLSPPRTGKPHHHGRCTNLQTSSKRRASSSAWNVACLQ